MKIAVIGAGGLGGYFGARLASTGHEVTFVARGDHLNAMRTGGLRVESAKGDLHLKSVHATDDISGIGPVDIVMVAVKLWDTESVAVQLKGLIGPETAVVSFQNGVDKDIILSNALGTKAVIGGICYIAAEIREPGVIRHTGTMQKLVFGELDGSVTKRVEAFHAACEGAGIDAQISNDIRRLTWEKFVFLVGLSGTTTSIRTPIGPIRQNDRTRAFLHDTMREVVAVGRAHDIGLAPDFADDRLAFCDTLPAEMSSSMHGDLKRGNRLELEWLSGAVVRMAAAKDLHAPCNRAILDILTLSSTGTK